MPISEVGKSGSFNPHYELGDLGIVPRKNEQILSNYEKIKLGHPQKELDSLKKLTRKTVGTQTIDFTRVCFHYLISFRFDLNNFAIIKL